MDKESELQIHSDISAALEITLDVSDIQVTKTNELLLIGKNHYQRFLIGSSLGLSFTHLFLFIWSVFYLNRPEVFQVFFNHALMEIVNQYYSVAVILLTLSLLLLSVSRTIARSAFQYALVIVANLCVAYLSGFLIFIGETKKFYWVHFLPLWYAVVYCGSVGLTANALISSRQFRPLKGVAISIVCFIIVDLAVVYLWQGMSLKTMEHFLFVVVAALSSCYYNFTAYTMLQRRFDYYTNEDWALGYAHLQTYFAVCLWYDWLVLKKGKPRDIGPESEFDENDNGGVELAS
jgi:hypothetical protein